MGIVSKLKLDHPALGTAGGAGLHASVEALYTKIGDNMNSRWFAINDFDQAETFDLDHNFTTDILNLSYDIWIHNGTEWVQLDETTTPLRSAFTVIEKVGFESTILQITNNTGGDNLTAAVSVILKTITLKDDVKDVDVTSIVDGQGLMYNSTTKKYERATKNYIGSGTLDASAVLQADSTTKGFLPPRMTQTERDAIASPANGLIVFNTTSGHLNQYQSSSWVELISSASQFVLNYTIKPASGDYTILDNDGYRHVHVTNGSSNINITLPSAVNNNTRLITVLKVDNGVGDLTITGTINGSSSLTIFSQFDQVTFLSNGSTWSVVSTNGYVRGQTSSDIIAAGRTGEQIKATISASTTLGATEGDVAGAVLPLTVGWWNILYQATVSITTQPNSNCSARIKLAVTNQSDVHVAETERAFQFETPDAVARTSMGCLSASAVVYVSSAQNYKIRGLVQQLTGSSNSGFVNTNSTNWGSQFHAIRI